MVVEHTNPQRRSSSSQLSRPMDQDRKRATAADGDAYVKQDPHEPPLKKLQVEGQNRVKVEDGGGVGGGGGGGMERAPMGQEEVEHFQKEAIYRQMQWYKREADSSNARVEELAKRSQYHDAHLRIVSAWWDQVLDEVKVVSGNFAATEYSLEAWPTNLFFADHPTFEAHLADKQEKIKDTVLKVILGVQSRSPLDVEGCKATVAKLAADVKAAQAENALLKSQCEEWESRSADAAYRYMTAEKKLDRMKSVTLAKIEAQARSQNHDEGKGQPDEKKPDVAPVENTAINDEMRQIMEKRGDDIARLETETARLRKDLLDQTVKTISPEAITSSEQFRSLQTLHTATLAALENAKARADILEAEVGRIHTSQEEFRTTLLQEQKSISNDVTNQMNKIEQDLARVRAIRDELHQDQQARKAKESEKLKVNQQIAELAEVRLGRVTSLEAEITRLKNEGAMTNGAEAKADGSEDLHQKLARLEKQNQNLLAELPSMEVAFNKAHSLATSKINDLSDMEKRLQKSVADKAKADQKYFAAMKSKEVLQQENKILKQSINKSSESISNLREAEKSAETRSSNSQKELFEWRTNYERALAKSKSDEAEVESARIRLDAAQKQLAHINTVLLQKVEAEDAALKAQRLAEEDLTKVRVQLEKQMANSFGGSSEEMQSLLGIAKCSSCRNNWKNTALKSCGHVFCKECVDERIASRSRKCPVCSRSFSSGEVMAVHL